MIIVMNIEGTVTRVINEPLYQGSNDVNKITLLAPFTSNTVVSCRFKLPNGMYVYPYILSSISPPEASNPYTMTRIEDFPGFFDESGKRYNMWSIKVDYPLTQFSGELKIQFDISSGSGNQTSSITRVDIGAGLEYVPPPYVANDDPNLATIMSAVGAAEAAKAQAEMSASSAGYYADDAIYEAHLAERYAIGEEDGVEVEGGIGYQNNAKYYAEQAKEIGDYYLNKTSSKADEAAASAEAAQAILDAIEFISGLDASDYYTKSEVDEKDEAIEDAVSALDNRLTVVEGRKVYAHKVAITLTADTYTSSNPYPLSNGGVWGFKLTTTIYNSDPTPFTFDQIYMGAPPFGSSTVNTMAWTGEINFSGTSSSNKLCKVITARRYPASSSNMLSLIICQMSGTATIYKVLIQKDALEVTDTVWQYE